MKAYVKFQLCVILFAVFYLCISINPNQAAAAGVVTITSVSDTPDPFSPNGDGVNDTTKVSVKVSNSGFGSRKVLTISSRIGFKNPQGTEVKYYTQSTKVNSGAIASISQVWDGKNSSGQVVAQGVYTYTVTAVINNINATPKTGTVTLTIPQKDTTPPTITLTQPATPTNQNVTLSYTVSDNVSAPKNIIVTGDSSPYIQERTYSVTLTAKDEAGNISNSNTVNFTIDKTPPAIIITSPSNGATVSTSTIILQGAIDGVPFSEQRSLQGGGNTLTKTAMDLAGNSSSASVTVFYDPGVLIGPEGGEVVSLDGKLRLVVPAGALLEPTHVTLSKINPQMYEDKLPNNYLSAVAVQCEPVGLILQKQAQLILKLDKQEVPGTEIALGLYNSGLDEIQLIGQSSTVASDGLTVSFLLTHFSDYFGLKSMISQGSPIGAGVEIPLPDLLTGSFSHEVPIVVPPGRVKMQPNISLKYNSSNANSWIGFGWNLNPGYIMRSTKHGVPSYNDLQDTFILVSESSATELVHLTENLYQARVESAFTKFFKESDDSWKVVQKDGTILKFGTTLDSREASAKGTFSWQLTEIVDTNANYIELSYTKDDGKSYLSRIEYTKHKSAFSFTHKIDFYLEDRTDVITSYLSAGRISMRKRLGSIEVSNSSGLIWRYVLVYEYGQQTNRSLLKTVRRYTKDGEPFPEQNFYYQTHNGETQ